MRSRGRSRGDAGATTLLVVILLSSVLLGMGAIATDTGFWFAERAQLQNGADAAALAVAQSCAIGPCGDATNVSTAAAEANANANDGHATVDFVCGSQDGGWSSACGAGCPPPPESGNWVNVHTSTLTASNGSALPALFGKALHGGAEAIHACAQASWGFPGSAITVPFTISQCEWYNDTHAGGSGSATYAAAPPYRASPNNTPWPPAWPYGRYDPKASPVQKPLAGGEDVLALHGTATTTTPIGDFDAGTVAPWKGLPNGKNRPALSVDTARFHDGIGSLRVTWNADGPGNEAAVNQSVSTVSGQADTLTAWVYVVTGQPAVTLYVVNGASTLQATSSVVDGWQQLSIPFTPGGTSVDIGVKAAVATTKNSFVNIDTVDLASPADDSPACVGTPNPPSGWDQPGGFGWLYDPNNNCSVAINVNNTAPDNTGASMDPACQTVLQAASCDPKSTTTPPCQPTVLFVPVYDGFCSNQSHTCNAAALCGGSLPPQSNGCYHFSGFASFVPTGFALNGSGGLQQASSISDSNYCQGNDKCVYGFFTRDLVRTPGTTGGKDLGTSTVTLTG